MVFFEGGGDVSTPVETGTAASNLLEYSGDIDLSAVLNTTFNTSNNNDDQSLHATHTMAKSGNDKKVCVLYIYFFNKIRN